MQHLVIWVKLLREKWVKGDNWTVMTSDFFETADNLTLWSPWAEGASFQNEPDTIPWWRLEKVFTLTSKSYNTLKCFFTKI